VRRSGQSAALCVVRGSIRHRVPVSLFPRRVAAHHGSAGIPPFRSDPLLSKPCGILRDLLREAHPRTDQRCSRKLFSLRVMQKPT
jgi:hypothetical protein